MRQRYVVLALIMVCSMVPAAPGGSADTGDESLFRVLTEPAPTRSRTRFW